MLAAPREYRLRASLPGALLAAMLALAAGTAVAQSGSATTDASTTDATPGRALDLSLDIRSFLPALAVTDTRVGARQAERPATLGTDAIVSSGLSRNARQARPTREDEDFRLYLNVKGVSVLGSGEASVKGFAFDLGRAPRQSDDPTVSFTLQKKF